MDYCSTRGVLRPTVHAAAHVTLGRETRQRDRRAGHVRHLRPSSVWIPPPQESCDGLRPYPRDDLGPAACFHRARPDELQPHHLPPEHRRRCPLPRLLLIDDGFASGADASGQAVLRESESATKGPELLIVVVWDRRQGSRTDLLPAESTVVCGHELRGGTRRQSSRPTKHGLHREVRDEPAGSNSGLQCANTDVEFLGQLVKRAIARTAADERSRAGSTGARRTRVVPDRSLGIAREARSSLRTRCHSSRVS